MSHTCDTRKLGSPSCIFSIKFFSVDTGCCVFGDSGTENSTGGGIRFVGSAIVLVFTFSGGVFSTCLSLSVITAGLFFCRTWHQYAYSKIGLKKSP